VTRLALVLILPTLLAAQPDRFSLPACNGPDQELATKTAFVLCHSATLRVPIWTAYELRPNQQNDTPRPKQFQKDLSLRQEGATNTDYKHSGYSRGHLVPAEDIAEPADTFLLSNTVPQDQSMNAGIWRQLENKVRKIAANSDAVYIITGTIFDSAEIESIGPGKVAVPTHLYKAVLALREDSITLYVAIIPNQSSIREPLSTFTVDLAQLENRTGLTFFRSLRQKFLNHFPFDVRQPVIAPLETVHQFRMIDSQ
jgi:endonuclease G